jgi:hypothetical protein
MCPVALFSSEGWRDEFTVGFPHKQCCHHLTEVLVAWTKAMGMACRFACLAFLACYTKFITVRAAHLNHTLLVRSHSHDPPTKSCTNYVESVPLQWHWYSLLSCEKTQIPTLPWLPHGSSTPATFLLVGGSLCEANNFPTSSAPPPMICASVVTSPMKIALSHSHQMPVMQALKTSFQATFMLWTAIIMPTFFHWSCMLCLSGPLVSLMICPCYHTMTHKLQERCVSWKIIILTGNSVLRRWSDTSFISGAQGSTSIFTHHLLTVGKWELNRSMGRSCVTQPSCVCCATQWVNSHL